LTLQYQNLSFRIEGFQRVEPFPFLITKKPSLKPSPERAPTAQARATAFIKAFQDSRRASAYSKPLHFAEQIPDLRNLDPNASRKEELGHPGSESSCPLAPLDQSTSQEEVASASDTTPH
jgi:hypothetical protein